MIRRGFVSWVLGLALIGYLLLSVGIALSTVDDCDEVADKQHWVVVPPQWECGPGRVQLTPSEDR